PAPLRQSTRATTRQLPRPPRRRAQSVPVAFTPTDIAGCQAWYDPSDLASITSSGGAVSQLNDKSGNARHLTQATGSLQPITGTRTQNGLNVIDFDGVDDYMDSPSFSVSQPFTEFVVSLSDSGADS